MMALHFLVFVIMSGAVSGYLYSGMMTGQKHLPPEIG